MKPILLCPPGSSALLAGHAVSVACRVSRFYPGAKAAFVNQATLELVTWLLFNRRPVWTVGKDGVEHHLALLPDIFEAAASTILKPAAQKTRKRPANESCGHFRVRAE